MRWVVRAVQVLLVTAFGLVLLSLFLAAVEVAVNRVRGYQLVTLNTKMYWENGKAVAGDKTKTWRIAVPNNIWLRGSMDAWSLFAWAPVYSNRREDFGSTRFVWTLTQLNAQEEIIAYTPGLGGPDLSLSFSNIIPNTGVGPKGGKPYFRQPGIQSECVSQDQWIDYHGWVVRLSPIDLSSERKCTIVSETLDRWTLHIDDLLSKDSGR